MMIMLEGSFLGDSMNCLHKVKSDDINLWSILNAGFVDSASANIGSGSRKSNTERPTSLGNLFSTLFSTFLKFCLTSWSPFAFLKLIWAVLLNALSEFWALSEAQNDEEKGKKNSFHVAVYIDYLSIKQQNQLIST